MDVAKGETRRDAARKATGGNGGGRRGPVRPRSAAAAPPARREPRAAAAAPAAPRAPGPVRTCVACRAEAARGELVRLVEAPDGAIAVDVGARGPGRGAW